jgi:replicative DNA helicase
MVELQLINKVLADRSDGILKLNGITKEYFIQYQEEYNWIENHKDDFGNIPDTESFLSQFPDFEIINVQESNEYLVSTFREEYLYSLSVPVITKLAELLQTDSYAAVDYLREKLPELTIPELRTGTDIISAANERLNEYKDVQEHREQRFIETGFKELDEVITGFHTGEELVVLFARTGQGKSWVLIKMLEHAWKMKKRVGLVEPEMSANKTGYRFDTVNNHISNTSLIRGDEIRGYEKYIQNLQNAEVPFYVTHPKDFQRKITVSKLRSFCESNKIDILAVDGISYLTDQRKEKGDNRTTQLTNISEDLMDLSIDLGIPILVVCQSNREGAKEDDLKLENIRDSDGIAYNASIVISVQQKEPGLQLVLNKSRNTRIGTKLTYLWDIDTGQFDYIPSDESGIDDEEQARDLRRRYEEDEDF